MKRKILNMKYFEKIFDWVTDMLFEKCLYPFCSFKKTNLIVKKELKLLFTDDSKIKTIKRTKKEY